MSATDARIPSIIAALLGLAMLATLSWQGYQFWMADGRNDSQMSEESAKQITPTREPPQIALSDVTLFGVADVNTPAETVNTENLPKTNLRLTLRGVLAADGDFPGSALIEDDKGNTEVYLVGNELPGNATLRSVHAGRVILERTGKLENLYFPEDDNRTGMNLSTSQQQREEGLPSASASNTPVQRAATPPPVRRPATPDATEQRREEVRQRLEELRERLRTNSN